MREFEMKMLIKTLRNLRKSVGSLDVPTIWVLRASILAVIVLGLYSYFNARGPGISDDEKFIALTAWSTVLMALVTAEAMGRQIIIARQTAQVEVLLKLLDKFEGSEMIRARITACAQAQRGFRSVYVGDGNFPAQESLLDFFESVGTYARRGIIDFDMLESELGLLMTGYKQILRAHANHLGMNWNSEDLYENFGYVVSKFSPSELSDMQLGRFLEGELSLDAR